MNRKSNISMASVIDDFLSLIYPRICMACGNNLLKHEDCICTSCLYHLPKTNFHLDNDNPVNKLFWGRVKIESASAFYYYNKGGKIQNLIHKLKYKGNKEIGEYIGMQYGYHLNSSEDFSSIDIIIPVPLHYKKQIKRGYNQSHLIVSGLSKSMKKKISIDNLYRKFESETQTRKTKYKRWENVSEIFDVRNPELFVNKHILLVDDVITTGATIEACANVLLKINSVRVSVIALACTLH
ncbi:ComF family protein [Bacteroidota bacterium]